MEVRDRNNEALALKDKKVLVVGLGKSGKRKKHRNEVKNGSKG